jgi:adenine-specific DNA-methyltransferase
MAATAVLDPRLTISRPGSDTIGAEALHASVRKAAKACKTVSGWQGRLAYCLELLENSSGADVGIDLSSLTSQQQAYWLSALYMLLMPPSRRAALAAYFTPPHLCDFVLDALAGEGFDFATQTALDPACGGAAFLVPLAERMITAGQGDAKLASVSSRIVGIEIEPGLARLSEALVQRSLRDAVSKPGGSKIVRREDSLSAAIQQQFDAVVLNPPYGRVFRPSSRLSERWAPVISNGHINTYALFLASAIERTKPGGLICAVVPTSFLAGPNFEKLRAHIRTTADVLSVAMIEKRSELFLDVVQDTCVLLMRKGSPTRQTPVAPKCVLLSATGERREIGSIQIPSNELSPWVLPALDAAEAPIEDEAYFHPGLSTLEAYGYVVQAGYFVWNRSRHLMRQGISPMEGEYPLIWARDVQAGGVITSESLRVRGSGSVTLAKAPCGSGVPISTEALVLQRTTNKKQARRLVVGRVSAEIVRRYGAFLTENHTIVIKPSGEGARVPLKIIETLLGSKAVDGRFRRISSTVSVSAKILRQLPLPRLEILIDCLARETDVELAIEMAYKNSVASNL